MERHDDVFAHRAERDSPNAGQEKDPFVLTGAQAIGGWTGRPRATHEVDILVKGRRNHRRAVKAIKALYDAGGPDFAGVTAFLFREKNNP